MLNTYYVHSQHQTFLRMFHVVRVRTGYTCGPGRALNGLNPHIINMSFPQWHIKCHKRYPHPGLFFSRRICIFRLAFLKVLPSRSYLTIFFLRTLIRITSIYPMSKLNWCLHNKAISLGCRL